MKIPKIIRPKIKFKYHPDEVIYQDGKYLCTFEEYQQANPDSGLNEGEYFEQLDDGSTTVINELGHSYEIPTVDYPEVTTFLDNPYPDTTEIIKFLEAQKVDPAPSDPIINP